MRTIKDDKSKFTTQGNTNGVYGNMERHINDRTRKSEDAKKRFSRKPWFVTAAENLRELESKKNERTTKL